ncbi:MAG: hypothetical protein DYG90_14190, partial [Chloroflexi bacterium CFX6]|nr:hypothetical protein [Chloroflexi bacterium CFX6]
MYIDRDSDSLRTRRPFRHTRPWLIAALAVLSLALFVRAQVEPLRVRLAAYLPTPRPTATGTPAAAALA